MTARAKPARLTMPPESSAGKRSSTCARPTESSVSETSLRISSSFILVCSRRGNATFSPIVSESNSAENWKAKPIVWRSSIRSRSRISVISLPWTKTRPLSGFLSPLSRRRIVDLPAPESPMMQVIAPSTTSSERFCTMILGP